MKKLLFALVALTISGGAFAVAKDNNGEQRTERRSERCSSCHKHVSKCGCAKKCAAAPKCERQVVHTSTECAKAEKNQPCPTYQCPAGYQEVR